MKALLRYRVCLIALAIAASAQDKTTPDFDPYTLMREK